MTLYNGYSYYELEEKNVILAERKFPSRKDYFKEQTIVISLSGFDLERSEEGLFKSNAAMLNISQLTYYIDSLNKKYNLRLNHNNSKNSAIQKSILKNISMQGIFLKTNLTMHYLDKKFDTKALFDSLQYHDKKDCSGKSNWKPERRNQLSLAE